MREGHVAGDESGAEARRIGEYFRSWPAFFSSPEAAHTFLGDSPLTEAWVKDLEATPAGLRPRFDPDVMERVISAVHVPRWEEWERLDAPTLAIFGQHGLFTEEQRAGLIRRRPSTQHAVLLHASHDAHLDAHDALMETLRKSLLES